VEPPVYDCIQLRDRGKPVPRWQQGGRLLTRGGLLFVSEEAVQAFRRTTLVARLQHPATHAELLVPLLDVRLLKAGGGDLVLTGVELLEDACYAQTWWLRLAQVEGADATQRSPVPVGMTDTS
jgi:hypothetical protein